MATFTAYRATDLINLDFNNLNEFDYDFMNNVNEEYKGRVFEDLITILDDVDGETTFGGRGMNEAVTRGTVTGVADFDINGNVRFEILDFEISASAVRLAIESTSRSDDKKILAKVFQSDDVFNLSNGKDSARGYDGNDVMNGRGNNDRLFGDDGNDRLLGGSGNDTLNGGNGKDRLFGDAGNDILKADAGNDTLDGGTGRDKLTGGSGDDIFVFSAAPNSSNLDQVTDFNVADDVIHLDNAVFKGIPNGNLAASRFASNNSGNAQDGSDRIIYEKDTGKLFYDRDGTGNNHNKVHFATLDDGLSLTRADFFIL